MRIRMMHLALGLLALLLLTMPALARPQEPAGVGIVSFTAQREGQETVLAWTTATEGANEGFYVLRAVDPAGPYDEMTPTMIPSQAIGGSGASYMWTDASIDPNERYWYELRASPSGQIVGPVQEVVEYRVFLPMLVLSQ